MATELAILFICTAFILFGVFLNGDSSFKASFDSSAPKLGARIEKEIETGGDFHKMTDSNGWTLKR